MRNRLDEIKNKGFKMQSYGDGPSTVDFNRVKVGVKSLDDATLNLGSIKKVNSSMADKAKILSAIENRDYDELREISNFFYETSGIYSRLCRYFASLYRHDWMVVPYVNGDVSNDKILNDFSKILIYLDNLNAKKFFGDISLKILRNGCYYGYRIDGVDRVGIQELPPKYCRSRFFSNQKPVVEFNMKFFDDQFPDIQSRLNILKMFPSEFSKGYVAYKEGKLKPSFMGDQQGWYMLDPQYAVKFNVNATDYPMLVNIIPSIIDLDEAQELDKKKTMQQLLKIVVQKMPLDKNGELIFDVDEAKDLHNNAVAMLSRAVGVDILTTFADIEVADLADKNSTTSRDDLMKVERGIYNQAGTSQGLFNTDGNLALEKSIINDEATMYDLLLQYEIFMNDIVEKLNKNKKISYKVEMLPTTIYNYKELAKLYKEQTMLGYSKMLPQIALGKSQSSVLAIAHFENEVLNLAEIMVPPRMSSTMSKSDKKGKDRTDKIEEDKQAGRKEKPDDQKSEKTIQNRESMN